MTIEKLAFEPAEGWNDFENVPTRPENEEAARALLQSFHDQTKEYINGLTGLLYAQEEIDQMLAEVVLGQIGDGTITDAKLSDAEGAVKDLLNNTASILDGHTEETTTAHGGIVPSSDVVTTAAANKLLKLNGDSKLPANITGDADTVDGKHAVDFQSSSRISGSASYTDIINASSTVTKNIAIGTGKKFGMAVLGGYSAVAMNIASPHSVLVFFNTDQNGAFVVGKYATVNAGNGQGAVWSRSKLGKITENYQNYGMYASGTNSHSYVSNVYISGSNLVVVYGNANPSSSQQILTSIEWVVW